MISTFGLLILILIIVLIVASFRSGSIGTLTSIIVAAGIAFFFAFSTVRLTAPRPVVELRSAPPAPRIAVAESFTLAEDVLSATWEPLDPVQFQTDLYPGIESAAKALGHQIGDLLSAAPTEDSPDTQPEVARTEETTESESNAVADAKGLKPPLRLNIIALEDMPVGCVTAFQMSLQEKLPTANFTLGIQKTEDPDSTSKAKQPSTKLSLQLSRKDSVQAAWNPGIVVTQGTLKCTVESDADSRQFSVKYSDKPWIDRFSEFTAENPARRFAVLHSTELASSPAEALESAKQKLPSVTIPFKDPMSSQNMLVSANPSLVIDEFIQKLDRPYGAVWRAAVLVDREGKKAEALVQNAQTNFSRARTVTQAARQSYFSILLTILGVFIATGLAGGLLNLVTEGYFRGRIMVVILTVGVVGIAGAVAILRIT